MRPVRGLWLAVALLYAFLWVPILVVVVHSFNASRFGTEWGGFTLQWYASLAQNAQALSAAKTTLHLAFSSTLISTALGTALGYGLSRYRFPGRRAFEGLLQVPIFIPDIVFATALLLFFSLVRTWIAGLLQLGLVTLVLGHVTFQLPFVAIVVRSRLAGLDPALEEAARDLGAGRFQCFRHVTLPLMLPGIAAGALLAFTLSLDDFVVSFFTSGPGATTLPILIYSSVRRGVTPEINALSTLIVLGSLAGAAAFAILRHNTKQP